MLAVPRLTRNEAQARSLIASRARSIEIFDDGAWSLLLEPAGLTEAPEGLSDAWLIRADWAGARFHLELAAVACYEWLAYRLPGLEVGHLPDEFVAAAFEAVVNDRVAALQALSRRGRLRILDIRRQLVPDAQPNTPSSMPHIFLMTLSGRRSGHMVRGLLRTDVLGLMVLAGLVDKSNGHSAEFPDENIPLRLRIEIGYTQLTTTQLQALYPQDVVLIEQCWLQTTPSGAHEVALWIEGRQRSRALIDGCVVTLLDDWETIVDNVVRDAPEDPRDVGQELGMFDDLPVRITFDVGDRLVSLAELKAMQPGQTFDLGKPLAGAVRVRANGVLIGHGELIQIDERLGVAVLSVFNRVVPSNPDD